jgi:Uma2 family endonuclease
MNEPNPVSSNELQIGEPAWRMALLFPPQGSWTEQDYLALDAGRQIEFDQGCIEVLDVPTIQHQRLVRFLFLAMQAFVESQKLGEMFFAPLPIRLWKEKYREPDLVYVQQDRGETNGYPDGADLVVEVVSQSPSDRRRDLDVKVAEYQQAGIPEYWIVDPLESRVLVHYLVDSEYTCTAFTGGQNVPSKILSGFTVAVSELFAAAQ